MKESAKLKNHKQQTLPSISAGIKSMMLKSAFKYFAGRWAVALRNTGAYCRLYFYLDSISISSAMIDGLLKEVEWSSPKVGKVSKVWKKLQAEVSTLTLQLFNIKTLQQKQPLQPQYPTKFPLSKTFSPSCV